MTNATMKVKHTPGPWRMFPDGSIYDLTGEQKVRDIYHGSKGEGAGIGQVEFEANCHVVHRSPELLAALKAVTDALNWHANTMGNGVATDQSRLDAAYAVIAKAEGRTL